MDLHQKVLEDIKKTGFVTELEVGSILLKRGWSTNQSETYQDLDSGKSREIDIIATKVKYDDKANFHLEYSLVIDVKRMKKRPWVVFTVPKGENFRTPGWGMLHCGYNTMTTLDGNVRSTIFRRNDLATENFRSEQTNYGIAFHEAFKTPGETSKAYESLISTCKAAWHKNERLRYPNSPKEFDPKEPVEVYLSTPLVILDGNLFEVTLDEKGDSQLEEVQNIPIRLNYSSSNYKRDVTFYPDLISLSYLEKYLELTEKWVDGMFESFKTTIIKKYR